MKILVQLLFVLMSARLNGKIETTNCHTSASDAKSITHMPKPIILELRWI